MSLPNSWTAFRQALRDDRAFRALGTRPGWYLRLHYRGRLEDRLGLEESESLGEIYWHGRELLLRLTASYAGALKGVFLDDEYALSQNLPTAPRTILDLGANVGMAAAALAAQFPGAAFVLVEPDPRNVARLRRTVALNALDAQVVASAVGPEAGELELRFDRNPTCSALETSATHDLAQRATVAVQTVPDLLDERGWDGVDLVKIDIEGTEEALLTTNNAWLQRVGSLVLEIHPACSVERIQNALAAFGFALSRHGNGREPVYVALRKS